MTSCQYYIQHCYELDQKTGTYIFFFERCQKYFNVIQNLD